MDFPSFHHHNHHNHHHRYVPPPNNFSDDRHNNIFTPHHFIQSVPPLIPYPPPPILHVPPPPPPPSYTNPNFTFFNRSSPPRLSSRFDYRSDPNRLHFPPSDYNPNRFVDDNNIVSSNNIDGYASVRSGLNVNSASASARVREDYIDKYEPRYVSVSENDRIWKEYGDEDTKWKRNGLGDYESESSKFGRVREGRDREEFKQVQKKSVLLRIGKRNSGKEKLRKHSSKGYVVETSGSGHRGKDKVKDRDRDRDSLYTEQKIEGDRERSPVDLDVSFKSNALVAKPVVTPSSPMSDDNNANTRNRKIKRGNEFDSPLSKFSERMTRSRSSSRGFESPSSSEKAPKLETRKDNVSSDDKSSLSGPVLEQADGNGGSKGQPLSFRLKKKRKLINPASRSFDFQLAVKDTDVKGESSKNISGAIPFPTLEEIASGKVDKSPQAIPVATISSVVLYPTQEEIIPNNMDKSPEAIVLEKDSSEVAKSNLHRTNSFGDDCTKNNITAQNVSMINDGVLNDLNRQPCGNTILADLENGTENIPADVKLSLGGTDTSVATSGYDQIEIQKGSTESNAGFDVVNVSNSLCNEPVKVQETSTTADMHPLDSCSNEVIIVSPEKSDDQGFLDDVSRKENESPLFEGTSNQISFNGSSELSEDVLKESTHTDIFAEDIVTLSISHKEHSFDKDAITEMVNSISTPVHTPSPDHREPSLVSEDDLPSSSTIVSAFANDADAFVTDSTGKLGESRSDMLTSITPSKKLSSVLDSQMLTSKSTDKSISDLGIPENDDNIVVKSVSKDVPLLNAPETGTKTSQREATNTSASQSGGVKTLGSNSNIQGSNLPLKKLNSVPAVPRILAARASPVFTSSRINKTVNSSTKPRTWHRSSSTPAPVPLPPKQIAAGQNAYIRSGNSLVRKGAPVTAAASRSSVYQLNPSGQNEARNSAGSGNKVNNSYSRVASASVVRPKTPPLSGSAKLPDCPTYSRDMPSSPLELLPASPVEGNFAEQKVSEDQIHTSSNSEIQKVEDEVVTGKKIQYVKRKSNQLVAAACSDQSVQDLDKTQAASSDSYYKRRKNQLIRTAAGDDSANTEVGRALKNSNKRQSGKVWTLNSQSLGKDGVSLRHKLRPQLFPWKRSRNWVNLMNLSTSISNSNSLSSISRKLLLSRKRETIYTRSKHGFSLRMSKLLSVGGSSLKWSKSIERNSKRTNEAATLAVAAAQKKKREQHGTASATAELKSRNNMTRDRIFRIGSVRYKMDPSRRTLQRISDEEPSNSMQSKEEIRKSYVPKRLKIGHDEYVRIGTGNQLVRNPKRRTRVFANEKVRWSLHTARTRLAKKKKFCQFFTRFGKCNKDDGKCPYIHDSSKIAVCTKFLNGLCSNPKCKLTHEVIPERMQDCSYFLQGLCSNNHCPYRHVNVNPAASVCEGFLKGYCADGNECRKKHSYACPVFEATGMCPQGTKCKLHHPKNQLKRKQQSSMDQQQKNSRGRYFGFFKAEDAMGVSEKHYLKNDDDMDDVDGDMLCQEGKFAEYISLDVGNEEAGEVTGDSRTSLMISESFGLDAGELDELTKPIRIMNRVVLNSPGECDMGVS